MTRNAKTNKNKKIQNQKKMIQAALQVLCYLLWEEKKKRKGGPRCPNTFTTYLWATKPRSRQSAPVPALPHTGRSAPPSFAATNPLLKCAAKSSAIAFPICALHTQHAGEGRKEKRKQKKKPKKPRRAPSRVTFPQQTESRHQNSTDKRTARGRQTAW